MTAWAEHVTRALADRKGVTSIEYAVIAGGATAIVASYNTLFTRVVALLSDRLSVSKLRGDLGRHRGRRRMGERAGGVRRRLSAPA